MRNTILIPDGEPDIRQLDRIDLWDTHFANRIFDCLQPYGWELIVNNHEISIVKPQNGKWILESHKLGGNIFQKGFFNPLYVIFHMDQLFLTIHAEVRDSSTMYHMNII